MCRSIYFCKFLKWFRYFANRLTISTYSDKRRGDGLLVAFIIIIIIMSVENHC